MFMQPSALRFCSQFTETTNKNKKFVVEKIFFEEIKFEGVPGKLESNECFQRQPFTKYLRITLVFMWSSRVGQKFNFCFSGAFP